ncbi:hypothetical protein G8E10_01645 [Rhizobiaceae bacterium CRRU44]|uniref:Uncharacterized protein n=1 Tax=Ferranicluibacter rubi TaxID=2715133 RepID=A0AA43ZCM9_9HYPH|nr:hypothetical protein [Ferranicluibacter rubi]NHT74452.1 hypothetical protein [Ferranicluibacter rubi]
MSITMKAFENEPVETSCAQAGAAAHFKQRCLKDGKRKTHHGIAVRMFYGRAPDRAGTKGSSPA